MFKKNATSGDVKKSQSKCLDVKRDTPTRLKHLRTVLGEGPTPSLFSRFFLPLRLVSRPCWFPRRSPHGGGLRGRSYEGHIVIICCLLMCGRRIRSDGEVPLWPVLNGCFLALFFVLFSLMGCFFAYDRSKVWSISIHISWFVSTLGLG